MALLYREHSWVWLSALTFGNTKRGILGLCGVYDSNWFFPLDHSVAAALAGNQGLSAKLRQQTELWRMEAVVEMEKLSEILNDPFTVHFRSKCFPFV